MRGRGRSWAHPKCPRLPFGANVLNNDHRPRRKLLPLLLRCHLQTCVAEAGRLLLLFEHLLPRSLCSFPSTHPAGAVSAWHSHCAAWGHATTVSLWPCWGCATSAVPQFTNFFKPLVVSGEANSFPLLCFFSFQADTADSPFILLYLPFHLLVFVFVLALVKLTIPLLLGVCAGVLAQCGLF